MKGGYTISKNRAALILLGFAVTLVAVGLMAGLINKDCDEGGAGDNAGQGGTTTTAAPATTTTTAPDLIENPWLNPFLPRNTIPLHYSLYMNPDFYHDGTTFTGQEDIHINTTEPTRYLIVHIKYLNITDTKVTDYASGNDLAIASTFPYLPNQYWVTELDTELAADQTVVLHLDFSGSLVNGIVGYYKSTYTNTDTGVESWLATTKFQPTDARKAYPCFDEPHLKANFTVSLKHWSNFTALSNMPIEMSEESEPGWNKTTFYETVPMSTYLVAFIVCDFNFKENIIDENGAHIPHKVWSSPDKISQTDYALEKGRDLAQFFQEEYNMTFHLPKLDEFAVPDYPSGATEHWGLITYREVRLLYDAQEVAVDGQISTLAVIAHELAHNYFGNVITNGWWDEIWLHEGFAVYYQYIGIEFAEPDWKLDAGYFAIAVLQDVIQTDALTSSRPVIVAVTDPDEINQAFDGISYDKGASMLRMVEFFMGKENFTAGIRRFLADHEFGVVTTDDLWASLQKEAGDSLNIKTIMDPWMYQMGVPVVNITDLNNGSLHATQSRFLNNPAANFSDPPSEYDYKWHIPLSYETASSNDGEIHWLNMDGRVFPDPRSDDSKWVKFNVEQRGYYRVNYPADMWMNLINQLNVNYSVFTAVDRSHLLDDAFNLARAGLLDYPTVLSMANYLVSETHLYPWYSAKSGLDYISAMFYGHQDYYLIRQYIYNLTVDTMDWLKVEDSGTQAERLLRSEIILLSCLNDNPDCLENTTRLFKDWINSVYVPPSLRQNVYTFGFRQAGTATEWDIMWQRYVEATVVAEKAYILYSLAQTSDLWLIQRYVSYCEDPTKVRAQDFFSCIGYLNSNPVGNLYAWDWARENYDELIDRFGIQDRVFGRMVPTMVSRFKTQFQLKEVEDFFAEYPEAGAGAAPRQQALDSIKTNIAWVERNQQVILDWLKA